MSVSVLIFNLWEMEAKILLTAANTLLSAFVVYCIRLSELLNRWHRPFGQSKISRLYSLTSCFLPLKVHIRRNEVHFEDCYMHRLKLSQRFHRGIATNGTRQSYRILSNIPQQMFKKILCPSLCMKLRSSARSSRTECYNLSQNDCIVNSFD